MSSRPILIACVLGAPGATVETLLGHPPCHTSDALASVPLLGPSTKVAWEAVIDMWQSVISPAHFNRIVDGQ